MRIGINRSNVWDYISQNALNGSSKSKLALHPTVTELMENLLGQVK